LSLHDALPISLPLPEDKRLTIVTGDIADRETIARLITRDTDAVFHLAAIVSGQAEADTDLGYRVNLDGTRAVLDACRALGTTPMLVFASSLAVYGGVLPPAVGDDTALTPQTSYGAQKAIGELLVNDYSRKGFVDGRALRLPTVVVRRGPVVGAAGLLGRGRRDGGGIAPRRRRGRPCPDPLAARPADPTDCLRLAAGAADPARRSPRLRPRPRHRRGHRRLHRGRSAG